MRALIYTRQSTDRQENTQSTQEAECRLWAQAQNLEVFRVYHDEVSGGVDPIARDSFCELLDELRADDIVVAQKRDRLGRDVVSNAITQRLITRKGARLVTLDCRDCDTPEGALLSTLLDAMAQYEKALISARTRKALADRKRRGLVYGNTELGTTREANKLTCDPEEIAKIDQVKLWRQEGLKLKEIQARCLEGGVTTRKGKTPTIQTISIWCQGVKPKETPKRTPLPQPRQSRQCLEQSSESKGLVALILSLRAQGLSYDKVSAQLVIEGYTNTRGNPISKRQLIRIVQRQSADRLLSSDHKR